jgi:hypothetical protein
MQEALASYPTHTFRARYQECEGILMFKETSMGTDGGGMMVKLQIYVQNVYGRSNYVYL